MKEIGQLSIVAVPIGHPQDITLRALDILKEADAVISEEFREGSKLLRKNGILNKELILLNEHNESEQTQILLQALLAGKHLALISDCGTPLFADPGTSLVNQAYKHGIRVMPVPGPSSLSAALSISPLPLDHFYFEGFLPRKNEERMARLKKIHGLDLPIVLMDAPFRLEKLLKEVCQVFGRKQIVTLAYDLTLPNERIFHDTVYRVMELTRGKKGEFVLILH
jgi:16S rRNA (cytidine1402-2'-O)-methyltransferase